MKKLLGLIAVISLSTSIHAQTPVNDQHESALQIVEDTKQSVVALTPSFQITANAPEFDFQLAANAGGFYSGLSRLIFNHWKHGFSNAWGGSSVRYASTFNDGIDGSDNMGSTATLGLFRNGYRLLTERRAGTNPDTLYLFHNTGSSMWGTFRISFAMGTGSLFVPGSTAYLYDLKTGSVTDISAGLFQTDASFNGPVYYDYTTVQSDPTTYGTRFMIVIHPPAN